MVRSLIAVVVLVAGCDVVGEAEARAKAGAKAGKGSAQPSGAESPVTASPEAVQRVDRLAGRYQIVDPAAAQADIERSVEKVVDQMNALVRPIARGRLLDSNKVPRKLVIERDGDAVLVAFDGRKYRAALDGSSTRVVGVNGDTLSYSVELDDTGLRQDFDGDGGGRINHIALHEGSLRVGVRVHSERLPAPVTYTLRFADK